MKDFFHKPPFPGRFVLHEHQPQEVIDDFDFAFGPIVLGDDFPRDRIDLGTKNETARRFRRIRKFKLRTSADDRQRFFSDQGFRSLDPVIASGLLRINTDMDRRVIEFALPDGDADR